MPAPKERWLPTPQACAYLGCSPDLLKRSRDSHDDGFLIAERHYRYSPSPNAPILWECKGIAKVFHKRGLAARLEKTADRVIKQLQEGGQ